MIGKQSQRLEPEIKCVASCGDLIDFEAKLSGTETKTKAEKANLRVMCSDRFDGSLDDDRVGLTLWGWHGFQRRGIANWVH